MCGMYRQAQSLQVVNKDGKLPASLIAVYLFNVRFLAIFPSSIPGIASRGIDGP